MQDVNDKIDNSEKKINGPESKSLHRDITPITKDTFLVKFERHSSAVQAFSAIIIMVLTVVIIFQANKSLDQQQKEEFIRLRAYVLPEIIRNFADTIDGVSTQTIAVTFKNTGQTPARDLTTTSYLLIDKTPTKYSSSESHLSIGPQQLQTSTFPPFKVDSFGKLSRNSKNFVVVEYYYKTYRDECFLGKTFAFFDKNHLVSSEYVLSIKNQYEEKVICKKISEGENVF